MAYRENQYNPESSQENMPKNYPKSRSRSRNGRILYSEARNPDKRDFSTVGQFGGKLKKNPGSFSKRYKKVQKQKRSIPAGEAYGAAEKIKLIREFESLNAPLSMFCKWYGLNPHTFKSWKQRFLRDGDAGLEDGRKSRTGRDREPVPEDIRADIIRLKLENQGIGVQKISDWLARNRFLRIGSQKVMQVLRADHRTAPLIPKGRKLMRGNSGKEPQHFERSKAREMYQMDIMTFMLHGLYRVYVIGCLDDYSRFVVSLGLFRRQTSDRCLDVLKSAIEKYGMPKEVLTDNGRQFYTWRGKSEFQKFLIKSGIEHIRSRPYHPQTLGKIESLWRNMYQELLGREPMKSFEDAEEKLKKWIEWYNYRRPHQGIAGMVPADRFFGVDKSMRDVMEKGAVMVRENTDTGQGTGGMPVYLVGNIDGKEIRIIAKEGTVSVEGTEQDKATIKQEEVINGAGTVAHEHAGAGGQEAGEQQEGGQAAPSDTGEGKVQNTAGSSAWDQDSEPGSQGKERVEGSDLGVGEENGGSGGKGPGA